MGLDWRPFIDIFHGELLLGDDFCIRGLEILSFVLVAIPISFKSWNREIEVHRTS